MQNCSGKRAGAWVCERPNYRTIRTCHPSDWRSGDRKSTRLNSSHLVISYAVFCLKKKKKKLTRQWLMRGVKKKTENTNEHIIPTHVERNRISHFQTTMNEQPHN